MKFQMTDTIQTMAFNPVTNNLFVGTNKDIGLFRPDVQGKDQLTKEKVKDAVKTAEWSPDGIFIAYGNEKGHVMLNDSNMKPKKKIVKLAPVTCISWSPLTMDHPDLLLVIACRD